MASQRSGRPRNPYVAGPQVGDTDAFIGRQDILEHVLRALQRPRESVLLFGQRRIGKTSILHQLNRWLPQHGSHQPVLFDLQNKATWSLERVLRALAEEIAFALGIPEPELGAHPERVFQARWLPGVLNDLPDDRSLVVLFDEFDVLAPRDSADSGLVSAPGEAGLTPVAGRIFFPYLADLLKLDLPRLRFVFVIGRNVNDLDQIANAVFKQTVSKRVTLLEREDALALVRLSEDNGSLDWSEEGLERMWELTHGHPYLTQQLCSCVWSQAYDRVQEISPQQETPRPQETGRSQETPRQEETGRSQETPGPVAARDVDAAVQEALEASRVPMKWLWDGLPPAARVVASALAEAGSGPVTRPELTQRLQQGGVRTVIEDLREAPGILRNWDLTEENEAGLWFKVEMLRRYVVEFYPFHEVQQELDYINPIAEYFYQIALIEYRAGRFDEALLYLDQTIAKNTNHLRANDLKAAILLSRGEFDTVIGQMERLFQYHAEAARPRLMQALLDKAAKETSEEKRLGLYERVLELAPDQQEAKDGRKRIWQSRGDSFRKEGDLAGALTAYQEAGSASKVAEVEREIRQLALERAGARLKALEAEGDFDAALDEVRKLAAAYPDGENWPALEQRLRGLELEQERKKAAELEARRSYAEALELVNRLAGTGPDEKWRAWIARLEARVQAGQCFEEGTAAMEAEDRDLARERFLQALQLDPGHGEAARSLYVVYSGVDPGGLKEERDQMAAKLEAAQAERKTVLAQRNALHVELGKSQEALEAAKQETERLETEARLVAEAATAAEQTRREEERQAAELAAAAEQARVRSGVLEKALEEAGTSLKAERETWQAERKTWETRSESARRRLVAFRAWAAAATVVALGLLGYVFWGDSGPVPAVDGLVGDAPASGSPDTPVPGRMAKLHRRDDTPLSPPASTPVPPVPTAAPLPSPTPAKVVVSKPAKPPSLPKATLKVRALLDEFYLAVDKRAKVPVQRESKKTTLSPGQHNLTFETTDGRIGHHSIDLKPGANVICQVEINFDGTFNWDCK